MWTTMRRALDRALYRRGFADPVLRGVVRRSVFFSVLALALGALLSPATPVIFWFGVGNLIALWNFYALARRIGRLLPAGWSSATLAGLLLHTAGRLFLTGFFLYHCLVKAGASPFALLAGLTVVVIDVTVCGLAGFSSRSRP